MLLLTQVDNGIIIIFYLKLCDVMARAFPQGQHI